MLLGASYLHNYQLTCTSLAVFVYRVRALSAARSRPLCVTSGPIFGLFQCYVVRSGVTLPLLVLFTASEKTYIVSSGAFNSTPTNLGCS